MADGVTVPLTGAGDATAKVATDDAGASGHIQLFKIAYSADGVATLVGADVNGLDVDVTRVGGNVATTVADGANVTIGTTTDADASGNGSLIGILKRLRTLMNGGLPAALGANSGLKVDSLSQAARSRTVDAIAVGLQTDAIMNGLTALTPKWALANIAASQTDSSIIAAVSSKKLRVLCAAFVAGGTATTIVFNSKPAGAGSAKSPTFANAANGGAILGFNPVGWFETVSGEGLTATTGAGSTTGVLVAYVEV